MVIVKREPKGFVSNGRISCVYVLNSNNDILFLQYSLTGPRSLELRYKWTAVSGKLEENESSEDCAVRELFEETGLKASKLDLQHIGKYFYLGNVNREVDDYLLKLNNIPEIALSDEHVNFLWVPKDNVLNLDLVRGRREIWLHQIKNWDRIVSINS